MKTNMKNQKVKKSGIVLMYYNGEPITIQCSDSIKLRNFLAQVSGALSMAGDFAYDNGLNDIANAHFDLKNIVHNARCNIMVL